MTRSARLPPRGIVAHSLETRGRAAELGFPAIIRPSFTLGGTGGGIAYNAEEFETDLQARARGLAHQRAADRGVAARLEGVRDGGGPRPADNCIIVCSIENLDPMGVHTGDSITGGAGADADRQGVPADADASIAILREIGVDTGGSNVQFAIDPQTAA
jgi:carbamoyl-phosphate synthase large subunit